MQFNIPTFFVPTHLMDVVPEDAPHGILVQHPNQGYFPIGAPRVQADPNMLIWGEVPDDDVLLAAYAASMFGWDCPAAKAAVDYIKAHGADGRPDLDYAGARR